MIEYQKKRFKEVLEKTEERKKLYEDSIEELKDILNYMEKNISINESDNVETIILKKYIECCSIKNVCEFINDNGYRITTTYSNRKYNTKDISQIIYPVKDSEDEEETIINADEELKDVVKKIHLYMYRSSYGRLKVIEFE